MHIEKVLKSLKLISAHSLYFLFTKSETDITKITNKFLDYIFHNLNSSLLSAEFLEKEDKFNRFHRESIIEIDVIAADFEDFEIDYPFLKNERLSALSFNSLVIIRNCLEELLNITLHINTFFEHEIDKILLNRGTLNEKIENYSKSLLSKNRSNIVTFDLEKTKRCYEILCINREVFFLDFFCDVDKKTFSKLDFFESELKKYYNLDDFKNISFIPVLLEKVMFLKCKILMREQKSHADVGNDLKIISKGKVISPSTDFNTFSIDDLKESLKYSKAHYLVEDKDYTVFDNIEKCRNSQQIHSSIKLKKDIFTNILELEEITKTILIDKSSKYNKYATTYQKMYAMNNVFSAKLDSGFINYEEAIKEYDTITTAFKFYRVRNYFAEFKLLRFLFDLLDSVLRAERDEHSLSLIKKYTHKISQIIKQYKKNVNWYSSNCSYLFPYTFQEGIIEDSFVKQNKVRHLFIGSGFSLPLDKSKQSENYLNFEQMELTYASILPEIELLNKEISSVEQLEKEYEKKDAKYIEILGIFSSIIIFASAAFNISSNLGNQLSFKNIFLIFLGIGVVLILFLSFTLLIARFSFRKFKSFFKDNGKSRLRLLIVLCLYISFYTLIYNLLDVLRFIVEEIQLNENFEKLLW